MTPDQVVLGLEARGLRLELDGADVMVRPVTSITADDVEVLTKNKAAVVALLRGRSAGVDWSMVSLYQLDRVLEIAIPYSDTNLIIAPGCRIAGQLRAQDPTPGRVWCVCEVLDLLLIGASPEHARAVAEAKIAFGARIGSVRPVEAKP